MGRGLGRRGYDAKDLLPVQLAFAPTRIEELDVIKHSSELDVDEFLEGFSLPQAEMPEDPYETF